MLITQKELQYIELWANRIPMPGPDYSKLVMEDIKKCYNIFQDKYSGKEYTFIFSNGEEINFEIKEANLCHMFGIDFNNIKGEYFNEYRKNVLHIETSNFSSFDLLIAILEYADKVIDMDNDVSNKIKLINYYKSQIKCNIFNKMSDFEKFNFAAINYNPNDGKFDYENQKLLFVQSNETLFPYFMMGIKLSNPEEEKEYLRKYIVSTLRAPQDPKVYFENQEVIIPTQLLITDNSELTKINASAEEKIRLLTMYRAIISELGIPNRLNIYSDYESILNGLESKKQKVLNLK